MIKDAQAIAQRAGAPEDMWDKSLASLAEAKTRLRRAEAHLADALEKRDRAAAMLRQAENDVAQQQKATRVEPRSDASREAAYTIAGFMDDMRKTAVQLPDGRWAVDPVILGKIASTTQILGSPVKHLDQQQNLGIPVDVSTMDVSEQDDDQSSHATDLETVDSMDSEMEGEMDAISDAQLERYMRKRLAVGRINLAVLGGSKHPTGGKRLHTKKQTNQPMILKTPVKAATRQRPTSSPPRLSPVQEAARDPYSAAQTPIQQ